MPRSPDGTFSLVTGNPVITGTTIESDWANTTMADIAQAMTESLSRTGEGGMLAPFKFADGTAAQPSFTYTNQTNIGFYRAGLNDMRQAVAGIDTVRFTANGIEKWDTNDSLFFAIPSSTAAYDAQVVLTNADASNAGKSSTVAVVDANDEVSNRFFYIAPGTTNRPPENNDYAAIAYCSVNNSNVFQMATNTSSGHIFSRTQSLGVWSAWTRIPNEGDYVNTSSNQDVDGIKTFLQEVIAENNFAMNGASNAQRRLVGKDATGATEYGNLEFSDDNSITASDEFIAEKFRSTLGRFVRDGAGNVVIGTADGEAESVYLRPDGENSTTNQFQFHPDGQLTLTKAPTATSSATRKDYVDGLLFAAASEIANQVQAQLGGYTADLPAIETVIANFTYTIPP